MIQTDFLLKNGNISALENNNKKVGFVAVTKGNIVVSRKIQSHKVIK